MDGLALVLDARPDQTSQASQTRHEWVVRAVSLAPPGLLVPVGRRFTDLLEPGSVKAGERMLETIRATGGVSDWELALPHGEGTDVMSFSGAGDGDSLLVWGGRDREDVLRLYGHVLAHEVSRNARLEAKVTELLLEEAKKVPAIQSALLDKLANFNSELAASQREQAAQNAALVRLDHEKNDVLGIVAHDLRNPIAMVKLAVDLLKRTTLELSEPQARLFDRIERNTHFMLGLVDSLLDLSVVESGRIRLETHEFDLRETLDEEIDLQQVAAEAKAISFSVVLPPRLALRGDEQKMRQVLNNLLNNAVKFSPKHSVVSVSASVKQGETHVMISDRGPGISQEEMSMLFKPFGRTRAKPTGGEKSTGLGLTIARRIVEAHGGRIWAESHGLGSVFHFVLPSDGRL